MLHFGGFMVPTGSVVVAEYESRLGEFDVFDYQLFDPGFPFLAPPGRTATLSYTSAPGAGPGQVVVTVVPEPVGAGIAVIAAGAILMRRRGR